jgi:hypothetical protein
MADVNEVMHKIRAKLYPNYLPGGEGTYVARTQNEATLSVEQVCAAATTRGSAVNSPEVMAAAVNDYLNESLYQLSDGFAVGNKIVTVYPNLGGVYDALGKPVNPDQKGVGFSFRNGPALIAASKTTEMVLDGIADTSGYIGQIQDMDSETTDTELTAGGVVVILGDKIKVEGEDSGVGVFFVNTADGNRVKVQKNLAENRSGKVIAVVPSDIGEGTYRLEIVTQYSHGGISLKEPRTVMFEADLTAA